MWGLKILAKIASSWGTGESEGAVGFVIAVWGAGTVGAVVAVWGATGDGGARRASSSWGDAWVYGLVDIPERRGNERLSSSEEGTSNQINSQYETGCTYGILHTQDI